jgi:16S rRNA (guanine527-N7)-methyltransferase
MPHNHSEFLCETLRINGYHIPVSIQEKMLHYLELLRQWNRVYNLTSILDPKDMILRHLLDSLSVNRYLHGNKILDVGTGAGLPGIPLALVNPEKQFVLLDSQHKKTRFLTHVLLELKIPNVKIETQRVENFHPEVLFNTILTRAFASLKVMLEQTEHLIAENGFFLAMKGTYPKNELYEIPEHFKVIAVHKLVIQGLDAERHLILMEKMHGKNHSPR